MTLGTRESTRADATRGNAWVESKPMGNQRHGRARLRWAGLSRDMGPRVLLCCRGGTLLVAMVLALWPQGPRFLAGAGARPYPVDPPSSQGRGKSSQIFPCSAHTSRWE